MYIYIIYIMYIYRYRYRYRYSKSGKPAITPSTKSVPRIPHTHRGKPQNTGPRRKGHCDHCEQLE